MFGFLAFIHESTVPKVEVFETVTFLVVMAESLFSSLACMSDVQLLLGGIEKVLLYWEPQQTNDIGLLNLYTE